MLHDVWFKHTNSVQARYECSTGINLILQRCRNISYITEKMFQLLKLCRVTQFKFLFKLCLTLSRWRSLSYRTDLFCKSNELFFVFFFCFFMIGPSFLKELKHYNSPRNILKIFGRYILWKTMGDASITDWLSIKYHLTHILFLSRF